jgi:hypothetical protein
MRCWVEVGVGLVVGTVLAVLAVLAGLARFAGWTGIGAAR